MMKLFYGIAFLVASAYFLGCSSNSEAYFEVPLLIELPPYSPEAVNEMVCKPLVEELQMLYSEAEIHSEAYLGKAIITLKFTDSELPSGSVYASLSEQKKILTNRIAVYDHHNFVIGTRQANDQKILNVRIAYPKTLDDAFLGQMISFEDSIASCQLLDGFQVSGVPEKSLIYAIDFSKLQRYNVFLERLENKLSELVKPKMMHSRGIGKKLNYQGTPVDIEALNVVTVLTTLEEPIKLNQLGEWREEIKAHNNATEAQIEMVLLDGTSMEETQELVQRWAASVGIENVSTEVIDTRWTVNVKIGANTEEGLFYADKLAEWSKSIPEAVRVHHPTEIVNSLCIKNGIAYTISDSAIAKQKLKEEVKKDVKDGYEEKKGSFKELKLSKEMGRVELKTLSMLYQGTLSGYKLDYLLYEDVSTLLPLYIEFVASTGTKDVMSAPVYLFNPSSSTYEMFYPKDLMAFSSEDATPIFSFGNNRYSVISLEVTNAENAEEVQKRLQGMVEELLPPTDVTCEIGTQLW